MFTYTPDLHYNRSGSIINNNNNKSGASRMKTIKIIALAMSLCASFSTFAAWQVVNPTSVSDNAFFQAGLDHTLTPKMESETQVNGPKFADPFVDVSSPSAHMTASVNNNVKNDYFIRIYPGTLRTNIERLMKKSTYKMLWQSPYDYHVISQATIKGKNFNDALNNLLMNYPVKAVFYEQNNIMTVVQRNS